LIKEFLIKIKKKFSRENEKLVKVAELKKSKTRNKNNREVCSGVQESS